MAFSEFFFDWLGILSSGAHVYRLAMIEDHWSACVNAKIEWFNDTAPSCL